LINESLGKGLNLDKQDLSLFRYISLSRELFIRILRNVRVYTNGLYIQMSVRN